MTKPIKNLGKATFDNRELAYNANLQLFNDDFCTDEVRLKLLLIIYT